MLPQVANKNIIQIILIIIIPINIPNNTLIIILLFNVILAYTKVITDPKRNNDEVLLTKLLFFDIFKCATK